MKMWSILLLLKELIIKTANIKEIKKRLNQYGVNGYLQLLIDKSLINYDDGSFAWG